MGLVEINFLPWAGDHMAAQGEEPRTMCVETIYFNGVRIPFRREIRPGYDDAPRADLQIDAFCGLRLYDVDPAFFDSLSEEEYVWGSTPEEITLIVDEVRFRELAVA